MAPEITSYIYKLRAGNRRPINANRNGRGRTRVFAPISHTTTKGETLKIHGLKVVTTADNSNVILEGLINALVDTPTKYANSTMAKFKLVPFRNTASNKDEITELIVRQNSFLHATMAIPS